jgi:hypothetical protein
VDPLDCERRYEELTTNGFKTRVRRGSCPRTAPLGARAEKHGHGRRPCARTPGSPARVFCALGWKRGAPFAVTRDRVLKPLLRIADALKPYIADALGESDDDERAKSLRRGKSSTKPWRCPCPVSHASRTRQAFSSTAVTNMLVGLPFARRHCQTEGG